MTEHFRLRWHDSGREPQVPPNPAYPEGIDVNVAGDAPSTCTVSLPYPAKRIGYFTVHCRQCGFRLGLTTAGRPDDPRSVTLPCQGTP